jgi:hypothetical protein
MKPTKSTLLRFLSKLHIYGGLFCSVFLLIAGISALNFQHKFLPETETDTIQYRRNIQFDSSLKLDTLARFIGSKLEVKGHYPPWEFREKGDGTVRFKIQRPARSYDIKLNRHSDVVEIKEIHYSTGRILRALHFGSIGNKLGDALLDIWSWYAQTATFIAFLVVLTSVYFWVNKSVMSRVQWIIIGLSGLVSIILTVYIWLVG